MTKNEFIQQGVLSVLPKIAEAYLSGNSNCANRNIYQKTDLANFAVSLVEYAANQINFDDDKTNMI